MPHELGDDAAPHHQHAPVQPQGGMFHRMVGHHQRIDERGRHVRDRVRQLVGIARRAREILRIGPVAHKADVVPAPDLAAKVLLPGAAHVAAAAVHIGPEGHAVAHGEAAVTGVHHHAAELVPHVEIRDWPVAPARTRLPHVHVAAADAAGTHPDKDHARPKLGQGDLLHLYPFRANEHGGLHGLLHLASP